MSRNEQLLKDILKQVVGGPKIKDKYMLYNIKEAWKKCFGPTISGYTTEVRFNKGTLSIVLSSAALRHELSLGKEKIMKVLNEELGSDQIKGVQIY